MSENGVERGYRALVELARLGGSELSPERIAERALQVALDCVGADSGELELFVDGHKQLIARRPATRAPSTAPASRAEAPIVSAGRSVGVLSCAAARADAFDELRHDMLSAIGAQLGPLLGPPLKSAAAPSDLSQSLLELRALHRVAAATRSLDLDEVLSRSLEITLEAAHAQAGAIYLRDDTHQVYRRTARRDVPDDVAPPEYPAVPVDARFPEAIPYVLNMDDPNETEPVIDAARRAGYRRILVIPLHVEGRPVGLLGLDYCEPVSLQASTLLTLEAIAGQEATAIEHARVHRVLARRAEVFGLLRAFGERALAPMDTHELALLVVQTAVQITRADRGLIGRINRRTSRVLAGVGTDAGLVGFEMPLDEPYMAQSLAEPHPIVVEDVAALEPQSIIARIARERNTSSFMFITMRHRGRPIGQLFTGSGEPCRYEPVEIEGMQLLSSMAAEVIERSRAEEEIETERARLGATIEHLPVVVAVLGSDGKLLHINAAARAFLVELGHDPKDWRQGIEGLHYSYPDGHELPLAELPVIRAFAGERPEPLQMSISDGHERHWTVIGVAAPLTDEEGRVQAVVTGFQDVTSLRELADAKDRFLRVASHELRSPITSLRATTALLEMDPSAIIDPTRRATMLQRIQRQVDRLIRLVEQLIDSARLNATEVPIQPTECDLSTIAREAIELARSGATGPTEVRLEAPPTVCGRWDPLRIEQVLTNLIGNALRYSPPGQEVLVTLTDGDPVKIEVSDRGIGIPKEQIDKLFTPFFRASNAAQHHKGGLGLGLYIAADIVRRHGGQIEVRSELGHGSTFTIELPRYQA